MPVEQSKFVDVVFPQPPYQTFTYEVPEALRHAIHLGHRVKVGLGRQKLAGIVVAFVSQPEFPRIRPIEDILDPNPIIPPDLFKLTQWIADYYITSWGEVIRAALPPGSVEKSEVLISRVEGVEITEPLSELMNLVITALEKKGSMSISRLEKSIGKKNIRETLGKLSKMGIVRLDYQLGKPSVKMKTERWIKLKSNITPEALATLQRKAPKQAEILSQLTQCGGECSQKDLHAALAPLRRLEEMDWIEMQMKEVFREVHDTAEIQSAEIPKLTDEQAKALNEIVRIIDGHNFQPILLFGVTSSGKTQVYIEAIQKTLECGRSALVLIPEISLTPQAVARYRGRFGDSVAVLHSRMSPGERFDSWRRIREGKCRIALGPRSAIFAPLENLGLIIIDEEHESSYKQFDPAPRYHARDVGVMRAKLNSCPIVLGSATPSLETYYNAQTGKYRLSELTHRIDHIPMPAVSVVNLESTHSLENRVFSKSLRERIQERLDRNEQIILLQNRRGYAPFLRCSACGHVEKCDQCDISLTFHQKGHHLRCHYCGIQKDAPDGCSECGGATLKFRGVGTQRVEEEIEKHFPDARLLRMDQDTTRRKGAHDHIVTSFEKGEGDILLGTQMVAKGHDFPGVTLVGIISADTGLHFPDFRSGERTYQLLTQTAGRAGRRNQQGEVIIQTHTSEHPVLSFAIEQDYVLFYNWEITQRKELGYPPWGRLVAVRFRGREELRVLGAAKSFCELVPSHPSYVRLGPVASPIARAKGLYRYQVIFKARKDIDANGSILRHAVRESARKYLSTSKDENVRMAIDVDPVEML